MVYAAASYHPRNRAMQLPPGCPDPKRFPLWPAIAVTMLTAAGFAIFKFVLLSEIALDIETAKKTLPFEFLRVFVQAHPGIELKESVMQGLAAILTAGVLVGYLLNAPLAESWRCSRLFVLSCLGMALVSLVAIPTLLNPWISAFLMGGIYGTACAARGKTIPLLALGNGRHNTFVNGIMNASLVVGLLGGIILGGFISISFVGDTDTSKGKFLDADWAAHVVLSVLLIVGTLVGLRLRVPEQQQQSFGIALKRLLGSTSILTRRYWSLLLSGGIAWGISTAFGLAMVIFVVEKCHLKYDTAVSLGVFGAIGAILGSYVSDWFARRRWVITGFLILAAVIFSIPYLVQDYSGSFAVGTTMTIPYNISAYWVAAVLTMFFGFFFMVPTNIIDARFLALAARDGMAGYGGSVFSLIHNIFILIISTGLAVALFLEYILADHQFVVLAAAAVLAAAFTGVAKLSDHDAGEA